MANKRFTVFDGDSHVVEPPELWTKYLEPEYRTLGKHALWREEGKLGSYLKVNGKVFRDTMNSNIPRHAIWRPGMTWDNVGELDPRHRHPMTEGASNPQARLRDMAGDDLLTFFERTYYRRLPAGGARLILAGCRHTLSHRLREAGLLLKLASRNLARVGRESATESAPV